MGPVELDPSTAGQETDLATFIDFGQGIARELGRDALGHLEGIVELACPLPLDTPIELLIDNL